MEKAGIRRIMNEECSHVKFDKKFLSNATSMVNDFVSKNHDHIEFFGGVLTGVQRVKFTTTDEDKLFIDLLEVNSSILEERLHALPTIDSSYHVSSDVFNITSIWLLYAIHNSHLNSQDKHLAKLKICEYLNIRYLTSRLNWHFRYPANEETAQAAYAAMSNKYLLKQLGSWLKYVEYRSEEIIAPHSIHASIIEKLDDDLKVVYMINDTQGRFRDVIKNISNIHYSCHDTKSKIIYSGATTEIDGEVILKDKIHGMENYTRYILASLNSKETFIKHELVDIVCDAMGVNMPPKHLIATLEWFALNYNYLTKSSPELGVIEKIVEHSFQQLLQHRDWVRIKNDLKTLTLHLRGVYMASKVSDPILLSLREVLENIISKITGVKSQASVASIRTGFMLYIILRTYSMNFYRN